MFIVSTTSNIYYAKRIADKLGVELIPSEVLRFHNGEIRVKSINISLRGKQVYVIFSTGNNINEEIMEALLLCWTIKQAHAHPHLIMPFYPYARQDKKSQGREPISARWLANLIEASSVETLTCVDLHNPAIQGFPKIPTDNLSAGNLIAEYIQRKYGELNPDNYVVVSPDAGGTERAQKLANKLGLEVVTMWKSRPQPGVVSSIKLLGDVQGRKCFVVDDMVDTCGTISRATETLIKHGAESVDVFATHGVLSGSAIQNLNESKISSVVITDTMNLYDKPEQSPKIEVLSTATIVANAILRHSSNASVSKIFEMSGDQQERELHFFRECAHTPKDD